MKWNLIMNIIFQKLFLENEYQTAKCNTKSKVESIYNIISQKFSLNFIYSVVLKHFKPLYVCCVIVLIFKDDICLLRSY